MLHPTGRSQIKTWTLAQSMLMSKFSIVELEIRRSSVDRRGHQAGVPQGQCEGLLTWTNSDLIARVSGKVIIFQNKAHTHMGNYNAQRW